MPSVLALHKEQEQERTYRRQEEVQATHMKVRKAVSTERDPGKTFLKLAVMHHTATVPGYSEQEERHKEPVQETICPKMEAIHRKREGKEVGYSALEEEHREPVVMLTFQEQGLVQRLLVEVPGKMVAALGLVYHPREVGKMDCPAFDLGDMVSTPASLVKEVDLEQGLFLLVVEAQEQRDEV
jgi:hypothetical protein